MSNLSAKEVLGVFKGTFPRMTCHIAIMEAAYSRYADMRLLSNRLFDFPFPGIGIHPHGEIKKEVDALIWSLIDLDFLFREDSLHYCPQTCLVLPLELKNRIFLSTVDTLLRKTHRIDQELRLVSSNPEDLRDWNRQLIGEMCQGYGREYATETYSYSDKESLSRYFESLSEEVESLLHKRNQLVGAYILGAFDDRRSYWWPDKYCSQKQIDGIVEFLRLKISDQSFMDMLLEQYRIVLNEKKSMYTMLADKLTEAVVTQSLPASPGLIAERFYLEDTMPLRLNSNREKGDIWIGQLDWAYEKLGLKEFLSEDLV
jgi:hypothetical protein